MPSAYFDVDGTLVTTDLLGPSVRFLANQATPAASLRRVGRALLDAPRMAWAETMDRGLFNEALFSHYRGISHNRMMVLAQEIYADLIRPALFPGARDLIHRCRQAGLRVVLITGSLDYTTRLLADDIGADHWIANRLEMKDGVATGKLMRPVVAGPAKANLIVDDARSVGHDLGECHAYSDSNSDVPMLSVVGHPSCINPDRKLLRLARSNHWPILDISTPARGPVARNSGEA
jgi:HAD superfamily hydrolase (TIGR01490 family)